MTMCSAESTADPNSGGGGGVIKTPDTTNRNPNRRSNKPIMEKRRRARINNCLNELKAILLEAMRKDPARHSKLEKADILELTVSHLKALHRHQGGPGLDGSKFRAGFTECAAEVGRFLQSSSVVDGIDHQTSTRLLSHLAECMNNPSLANQNQNQNPSHHHLHHPHLNLSLNGHSATTINSNGGSSGGSGSHSHSPNHNSNHSASGHTSVTSIDPHGNPATLSVPANTPIISLVPSRLSSGEIAFVVPGFNSNVRGASTPSSTIPMSIPLAALHCNPPAMLSPELPLELTVPSSSSSSGSGSLSPNYPISQNQNQSHHHPRLHGHGHHHPHSHIHSPLNNNNHHHYQLNGIHPNFSPTSISSQPLALVTPKKEDRFQWRPWAM